MRELETESLELLDKIVEEFASRIRGGESLSVDDFVKRYPALESQLRLLLPTTLMLEQPTVFALEQKKAITEDFPILQEYRFIRELGRGGMGIVYEAEHLTLGRSVAVKILPSHLLSQDKARERFQREAKAAARMHHSNIVPVFEVGTVGKTSYYSMQLIQGETLANRIKELQDCVGPDVDRMKSEDRYLGAAKYGIQLADALHYAHMRGVLHRDIKPSNILIDTSNTAWLTDFGLASLSDDTQSQDLVGTLKYLAPERFIGQTDARSDIYSLGLTLYEFITLQDAISGGDRAMFLAAISAGNIRPLQKVVPDVPRDLATIIEKSIQREPARRYITSDDLAKDLARFLAREPIQARPVSAMERLWMWSCRNPMLAATTGALNILLVLSTIGAILFASRLNNITRDAQLQAGLAQRNELAAERVSSYLVEMIQGADPSGLFTGHASPQTQLDQTTTAFEWIANSAKRLEEEDFSDVPLVEAQIKDTLGVALTGQMKMGEAGELLRDSLLIRRQQLPENHLDIAASLHHLGTFEFYRGDPFTAVSNFREALSIRAGHLEAQESSSIRPEDVSLLRLEYTRSQSALALALAYSLPHPSSESLDLLRSAIAIRRSVLGPHHIEVAYCHIALASIHARFLESDEALEELKQAESILAGHHGDQRLTDVFSMYVQGTAFQSMRLTDLAVNRFTEAGTKMAEVFGPNHPLAMYAQGEVAGALELGGRHEQAESIYREVIAFNEKFLPNQPFLGRSWETLGKFYASRNEHSKALDAFRSGLDIYEAAGLPKNHPLVLSTRKKIAIIYTWVGRLEESFNELDEVVRLYQTQPRELVARELYTSLTHMAYLTMWNLTDKFSQVVDKVIQVGSNEREPEMLFHLLDAGTRGRCSVEQAREMLKISQRWVDNPLNEYDSKEAHHFRARLYYFLGMPEQAMADLRMTPPNEAREYQAKLFSSLCLKQMGKEAEAQAELESTILWLLPRVDEVFAKALRDKLFQDPVTDERPLPERLPTTIQFQWDQTAYAEVCWRLMHE